VKKVKAHTAAATIATGGISTRKAPAPVATPLPPLKWVKQENACPSMAEISPMVPSSLVFSSAWTKALSPAEVRQACQRKYRGQPAATAPLIASSTKTVVPARAPRVRRTLVAPGLLLPTAKMFTPRARATR